MCIRDRLKNFDSISVREIQGTEFTQEYTDKPVVNVLDPTLLLDAEDYAKIAVKPKEKHYLLVYNCLKNNRKMLEDAHKIAKERGLEVIEISVFYTNIDVYKRQSFYRPDSRLMPLYVTMIRWQ